MESATGASLFPDGKAAFRQESVKAMPDASECEAVSDLGPNGLTILNVDRALSMHIISYLLALGAEAGSLIWKQRG